MKKSQNVKFAEYGKQLAKEEQKKIAGGVIKSTTCVCTGSTNHGAAFFCIGGIFGCVLDGIAYCGGNAACSSSQQ